MKAGGVKSGCLKALFEDLCLHKHRDMLLGSFKNVINT